MAQGGQKVAGETPAGPRRGAWQQNPRRFTAEVKLVYAHNTILHIKVGWLKIRYTMEHEVPQWVKELVDHIKKYGKHRKVKRVGYSRFWRARMTYENDVYEMEMSVIELVQLITAAETWKRSPIARKIIELVEKAVFYDE